MFNKKWKLIMKKVVIVPDSFKGSLSSIEACKIISECVAPIFPGCEIAAVPVADGGEGSVDCFVHAADAQPRYATVSDPYGRPIDAKYCVFGGTAVVEAAQCVGLTLVGEDKNPEKTTTLGVGETILAAAQDGAQKIVVAIGGSCTNDGGAGAAAACGVKFYDKSGAEFVPVGGTLCDIDRIDVSRLSPAARDIEIEVMCDVDNPLCGERGAAYVFAPQKGADDAMVKRLDAGLSHFAQVVRRDTGLDVLSLPGGGAAGGLGAGLAAFFGAKLRRGTDVVLDTVGFDAMLDGADIVFTGEGRFDSQSMDGKLVSGVAARAKAARVPVIVLAGDARDVAGAHEAGVTAVFPINRSPGTFEELKPLCTENMRVSVTEILRLIVAIVK